MTRLMHLADLHLGRKFENLDLLEDQRAALEEIIGILRAEKPDGLMICGDVYDRSVPPAEAVTLLDDFLTRAAETCPVFLISGNHDSGERLSFAASFLRRQNLYVAGAFLGTLEAVTVGEINLYLLPYTHPGNVAWALGQTDGITSMDQAVRAALSTRKPGMGRYNVLMAHLFVTASGGQPETCESEAASVGTLDQVDVSAFDGFDYVALGHLHRPQWMGRETVRYAGTPLPYSFSEDHGKSVTMVECADGRTSVRAVPLHSGHRMRTVTGFLADLTAPGYDAGDPNDSIQVRLLDKTLQVDARARLKQVFPRLVGGIQYPNYEWRSVSGDVQSLKGQTDAQLLESFWRYKRHEALPEGYRALMMKLLGEEEP